ncbi:hypothetical protein RG963_04825 [Methanosarcina sp. Z-7115]|uniref:Uncharacterized protein n=1 Tax=Methanosarcina baikalica TaxID=3073890 RepID=A0ABU2CZF7_9EURY|nr:hypothetical protein [Methanosarcina sp. Z-7115]MDR7665121.1 hypothetical protein [Methanosarcina sp. Z-7115]
MDICKNLCKKDSGLAEIRTQDLCRVKAEACDVRTIIDELNPVTFLSH